MKADDVARYLRENPTFFETHADMLADISIPHPHGGRAIPLSDRQMLTLREKLIRLRTATFRALCTDCTTVLEVVARFLALLELYREGVVAFDQIAPLGELLVRWTGAADAAEPPEGQDIDEEYG